MSAVAIIPCRAESKGIPGKNRAELNGSPLFLWSVAAALECEDVRTVCVTTDDEEIISWGKWAASRNSRITCLSRPKEMATDESPTEPCLFHACDHISVGNHEYVFLLQPTSPFRHGELISRCMTSAKNSGSSFTAISPGHIMWLHGVHASMPLYDPTQRPRRQYSLHSPVVAFEDGNIYCSLYSQMKTTKTRFGDSPNLILSSPIHSVQIDSTEDLDLVRDLSKCKQVNEWMQNVQALLPK